MCILTFQYFALNQISSGKEFYSQGAAAENVMFPVLNGENLGLSGFITPVEYIK